MLRRYAMFVGQPRPGMEDAMRAYVHEKLAPLWRQFDGAAKVELLWTEANDPNGDDIPLTLAVTYEDEAAMAKALDSPARYESRDLLPEFFATYFDGKLLHYTMRVEG